MTPAEEERIGGSFSLNDEESHTLLDNDFDKVGETADDICKTVNPNNIVFYEIFLIVMPVFCGYAALFSMQSNVMAIMYPGVEEEPHIFGLACSMLYVGNLVFRLGHNIIFFPFAPRYRVVISIWSMVLSMGTICVIFILKLSKDYIWMVFIGYGLGGVAIGTFEANVLSMISVLGKDTKLWAIIAIPVGINVVNIGGYLLLGLWPWLEEHAGLIQFSVLVLCVFAYCILFIRIFRLCKPASNTFSLKEFFTSFLYWREWMYHIRWNCLALMIDMFFVSLFSPGVILYIYNGDCVVFTFLGWQMNREYFIALYNTFFFLGDTISRKVFYHFRLVNPMVFLLMSFTGMIIGLSDITILVPICPFLVAFANGSIYTQTNRLIDNKVSDKFNLISLSFWLFIGDFGSVFGSNIISYLDDLFVNIYGQSPACSS